ncbi:MAG TPA: lamin tail domain-containing protein [Thermoanaerobaculia bacterium]|jgi:hypothetical protein
MQCFSRRLPLLSFLCAAGWLAFGSRAAAQVVISQIYGGGGAATKIYGQDYVELFNRGASPVSLAGWSVQYASATGTSWEVTALSGSIAAGRYYLVGESIGAGDPLPTPDANGSTPLSNNSGKVALVATTAALSGGCPVAGTVDFVGYGSADCSEGGAAAPTLTALSAGLRRFSGCQDTNQNSADFESGAPLPRNSASPTNTCAGGPTPTPTPTATPTPPPTPTPTPTPTPSPTPTPTATPTPPPTPLPGGVVVSQVYGGGGAAGATFSSDFVELFNSGSETVSLEGWSVQYASATASTWHVTDLSGTIAPGRYYLVGESSGGSGAALSAPDATGSIPMAASTGKIALVDNQTPLTGLCPSASRAVHDFVGYGGAAVCFEGSGPTSSPGGNASAHRLHSGCQDTDQNAFDFALAAPVPRNSGSPTFSCSAVPIATPTPTPTSVVPEKLVVDRSAGPDSDGNGVFEPGETVSVEPSWRNHADVPQALSGVASELEGPEGATYTIVDEAADYGAIGGDFVGSCNDTLDCYSFQITAAVRPSTHWDAAFTETPSGGHGPAARTLHLGDSFTDVPRSQPFYVKIETLLHAGITSGCAPGAFCPAEEVSRGQMAIFVAKALARGAENIPVSGKIHGADYDCSDGGASLFSDVEPTDVFCKHVHYLAAENVTLGCDATHFCPEEPITRDAMASFIAKALVAPAGALGVPTIYSDPDTGREYSCAVASPNVHFTDVPAGTSFCKHVHYLWAHNVIAGCGATSYCPGDLVRRDAMAKFLANAFQLPLYGP